MAVTMKATKTVDITTLQGKHFIAWLRKQVRTLGRNAELGYIGDHCDRALELFLKDVLHIEGHFEVPSCDAFTVSGKEYFLSQSFCDFTICALEGNSHELPECGYRVATAYEILQQALDLIDPEAFVVASSEATATKQAPVATTQATVRTTVHITWTQAPTIRMKANVDMPEYGLKKDQTFYLSRASSNDGTYYILTWSYVETRWTCPCKWGSTKKAQVKPCRHANDVNVDIRSHKVTRKLIQEALTQPAIKAMTVAMRPSYPAVPTRTTSIETKLTACGFMK